MRWASLFADLEAQAEGQDDAEFLAEVRDRTRLELGRLRVVDRLRASEGRELAASVRSGDRVSGILGGVGPDWLLLAQEPVGEALIPLGAVSTLTGLDEAAREPGTTGLLADRLDLRYLLRRLARDRERVQVSLDGGGTVAGVLVRVAVDHVEIAEHPRRPARGTVVPLGAVTLVRSVTRGEPAG
jgi:hypothetical protein